ncbi:MAG: hypothetical protein PHU25_04035 [Deltaproteobacteria bacterium]|nr:hypothetical protein [Deltaproteobacteria bacterium]
MGRQVIIAVFLSAFCASFVATAAGIDRDTVIATAASYANHKWTSTSANVYASCSSSYKSDYSPGTHTGVPYDWGGYMTLNVFDSQIAQGYGAGSHSKNGVLACTAGVDCSGFVSMCWGESHYGTTGLPSISTAINKSTVKKGDIFNKAGSHVVLFSYLNTSGAPVFYEASGSASKVRLNTTGGWTFVNNYIARRYNKIVDSQPKTCPGPKAITKFPFSDTQDTTKSGCDSFDTYSCASTISEKGPEYVYVFNAAQAGQLTASVTSGPGVDIDIHLLSKAGAGSCVARNDQKISVHIEAGTYYLAADTWVDSSGVEYAGPFTLNADFVPDAPDSDTTPATGVATGVVYEDVGTTDMTKRITGATVNVVETGATATAAGTEALWSFTLPPAAYAMKASATGYDQTTKSCTVVSGTTTWCNIGMKKTVVPSEDVITISSFPYTDTKNTKSSTRDQFDTYSCATGINEKGPEYVYKFTVATSGTLSASLTYASGVDIDIHLLSAASASACLARNDTSITTNIAKGTYYLVADSYTGPSGTDYPGQYTLNVTFAADVIYIPSFPYTDSRSTKTSNRDKFDSYSCATSTGEKGPEYVYMFTVSASGTLTATLTYASGVDVDIHLLSSLSSTACVKRADKTFSTTVAKGTYYLVADSYSGPSGTEYPGQYSLNVTFK